MYIATERGVEGVFCKTLKDRIRAIIQIAHPEYRQELNRLICTFTLIEEEDFSDLDIMKIHKPKARD